MTKGPSVVCERSEQPGGQRAAACTRTAAKGVATAIRAARRNRRISAGPGKGCSGTCKRRVGKAASILGTPSDPPAVTAAEEEAVPAKAPDVCEAPSAGRERIAAVPRPRAPPSWPAVDITDIAVPSAEEGATEDGLNVAVTDEDKAVDVPAVVPQAEVRRRVQFDLDANIVHEIIPYSEIYGVHPRDFVFGRGFYMIPAFQSTAIDILAAARFGSTPPREEEDEEAVDSDTDNEDECNEDFTAGDRGD